MTTLRVDRNHMLQCDVHENNQANGAIEEEESSVEATLVSQDKYNSGVNNMTIYVNSGTASVTAMH